MKKIIFIVLFFISAGNCFGQQVTFHRAYGTPQEEYISSVIQNIDNGYTVVGTQYNTVNATGDCYLIKINAIGDISLKKIYGEGNDDWAYCVEQTNDSGFIFVGTTNSFGNGDYDFYLVRINASGNVLWSKTYGKSGHDEGTSVIQTFDGGFLMAGYMSVFGAGNDVCLIKTDSSGNVSWSKTYGGTGDEFNVKLIQTFDSGFALAGSTTSFGAGGYDDFFLIKTNTFGDTLWSKTYGSNSSDDGYSIVQTTDGGFLLTGSTFNVNNDHDVYLIKTDNIGNLNWSKTYNGSSDHDYGYSGKQIADGGYIIVGTTLNFGPGAYNSLLIKTDSLGNIIWSKTYGTPSDEWGYDIIQTNDGGFLLAGDTYGFGPIIPNYYLIKTDSMGNSGCNENIKTMTSPVMATIVTSPAFDISVPILNVTSVVTQVANTGTVTTLCTTVGIEPIFNFQSSIFNISPNPATNNFTITFPTTINKGVIEIYNVMGEKIFEENIINVSQKEMRLENMEAGIYFVKVNTEENFYTEKLIIQ